MKWSQRNFGITRCLAWCLAWSLMVCSAGAALAQPIKAVTPAACMPAVGDYTMHWWADGFHGRSAKDRSKVLCFRTGRYGLALDVEKGQLLHLGRFAKPVSGPRAMLQGNEVVFALPASKLDLAVTIDGQRHTCLRAESSFKPDGLKKPRQPDNVRVIEAGRFVQRIDVGGVIFAGAQTAVLPARGRLEVTTWPDRMTLVLEVTAENEMPSGQLSIGVLMDGQMQTAETAFPPDVPWREGQTRTVSLSLYPAGVDGPAQGAATPPDASSPPAQAAEAAAPGAAPTAPAEPAAPLRPAGAPGGLAVTDVATGHPLVVRFDKFAGMYRVDLPGEPWPTASPLYYPEDQLDRLERFTMKLTNPTDRPLPFRVQFNKTYKDGRLLGITGMTPMLRDPSGDPTGIPVQLSKNWHIPKPPETDDTLDAAPDANASAQPAPPAEPAADAGDDTRPKLFELPGVREADDGVLHAGPWARAYTLLRLPPKSELDLEFAITYARWGGVPAASHAQLSLIGWSEFAPMQLWEQVAIGSFGESICYDPPGAMRQCAITDWRPLLVWQRNSGKQKKYGWTCNVGGGDLLVYYDGIGRYQPLAQVKVLHQGTGPNLTYATYSGVTADGHIRVVASMSTPRCDDLNRTFVRIRYDVLKPTPFKRMAFFQLGADGYNPHHFATMSRGNEEGVLEEWQPARGGEAYDRTDIPCEGKVPWFSLHGGTPSPHAPEPDDTWANRGVIIRDWRARLGGQVQAAPVAAVYKTQDGPTSGANWELAPPQGLTQLEPGDSVQAELELIVVPKSAKDYYGPNANFRAALDTGADTWRPVHRQAVGNDLRVQAFRGTVGHRYPVVVAVDGQQVADFEVTGGVGYVPVVIVGLKQPNGFELWRHEGAAAVRVNQAVHGNDFWQTDYDAATRTYRVTYNVPLDTPGDRKQPVRLVLRKK